MIITKRADILRKSSGSGVAEAAEMLQVKLKKHLSILPPYHKLMKAA